MKFFLGIEVFQNCKCIFLTQSKYIEDLLKKFHMESCKPVATLMVQNTKFVKEDESTLLILMFTKI